jgi:predicted dithiol-disulfide oxidoreductase (DUF899 family)
MPNQVVSRDVWLKARVALLEKEKAFSKARDALSSEQRGLPWVRIEKDYIFDTPSGWQTLSDLFGGRSQLFVKHFMMAPGQQQQCVGCSFTVDHVAGILPHLENHDVTYVAVARAPLNEIEALCERMDWHFPFVSSYGSDFNYDFNVSFTPEQMAAKRVFYNFRETDPGPHEDQSGHSVFYKDEAGQIFHTYATFGRGDEQFMTTYGFLDVTPKGRNEFPRKNLVDWVRPHNMYGEGGTVLRGGRFHAADCGCGAQH